MERHTDQYEHTPTAGVVQWQSCRTLPSTQPMSIKTIAIEHLRVDPIIQQRVELNEDVVTDYAEAMCENAAFPPVMVFDDGDTCWVADGFHRVEAAKRAQAEKLPVAIRPGSRREAILWACGANAQHGLRRTSADKRKAVTTLLTDTEWGQWSDKQVAAAAGVSREYVVRMRKQLQETGELSCDPSQDARLVQRGDGVRYVMSTGNIGKTATRTTAASGDVRSLTPSDTTPLSPLTPPEASSAQVMSPEDPFAYPLLLEPRCNSLQELPDVRSAEQPPLPDTMALCAVEPPVPQALQRPPDVLEEAARVGCAPTVWLAARLFQHVQHLEETYAGITVEMVQQATNQFLRLYLEACQARGQGYRLTENACV